MRILNVKVNQHQPYSEDTIDIMDTDGNTYTLTGKQIEDVLIEDGQRCETCGDTGEVTVDEPVYPGEPHMAPIGTAPCPDCRGKHDDE